MRKLLYAVFLMVALTVTTRSGSFTNGSTTCPTSGNKQVSNVSTSYYSIVLVAPTTNAGFIYVGGSTVTTANGAGPITPGSSFSASKPNAGVALNTLYFACATNTDAITWIGSQ